MASVSYSKAHGLDVLPGAVTEGTSAPGAGDIELRIDLTKYATRNDVRNDVGKLLEFLLDPGFSPTIPL